MSEREYAEYVRDILKQNMDSINAAYEDFIRHLVGIHGLNALKKYELIECLGWGGGKELYALKRK